MRGQKTGNAGRRTLYLSVTLLLLAMVLSSCFLLKENLTVYSYPSGVNVTVDDQSVQTPATLQLTLGEHTVNVLTTYKTIGNYAGLDNTKYVFSKWSDGSLANPRTVNLDSAKSYSAQMNSFYKMAVSSNVSGASLDVTPSGAGGFYPSNSQVTLTAQNVPGYIFQDWKVNGSVVSGNPYTQYMTLPVHATAEYVYNLPPDVPSLVYPADNAAGISIAPTLRWYDTDPNGQSLSYDLYLGKNGSVPQLLASNISSASYALSGLDYSASYSWYVTASDGYNTTKGPTWSFTTMGNPVPAAPANLHKTSVTNDSVSIAWDAVSGATGYRIYRSLDGTSYSNVDQTVSNSYADSGLSPSTTYYYKVTAYNASGESPYSGVLTVTTQNPPVPAAPANLHTTSVTSNSVALSWNAVSGATGYKVYRSTDGTNYSDVSQATVNSYTDGGLSPSTTYYYKVTAYNSYGESGFSGTISANTEAITSQGTGTVSGTVNVYTGQSAFISSAPVSVSSANWRVPTEKRPSYVPGQIVVGFKKGYGAESVTAMSAAPFGYKVVSILKTPDRSVNSALLEVSTSVENAVEHFKSLPGVAYAEPNYISYALSVTPNDPYYTDQWNLPDIKIPQAWQVTKGGNSVIVAVLDTGVSSTHPDLKNVLVPGYNFVSGNTDTMDDYGHGTHVAGIIAAQTDNSIGIAGVDWGGAGSTKIMPVKVLDSDGGGTDYAIAQGIVYAVEHGARVINMSLGGTVGSSTEQYACQYAYDNGVTLVAAAGNNYSNSLEYPAAFSTVIPVAAVGPDNTLAYYSNYTSGVICAPGGAMHSENDPNGILSTYYATSTQSNTYAYLQGTSMAAPHVSAVAALMISNGITGPANIWNVIKDTAENIGSSSIYGYGLINAYSAVTYNGGWHPMIVFARDLNGNLIASTNVAANGDFSLALPAGSYKIYAWQDFNGDDQIDTVDFYGFYGYAGSSADSPTQVSVTANGTVNVGIYVSPEVNNANNPLGSVNPTSLEKYLKSVTADHYKKIGSLTF